MSTFFKLIKPNEIKKNITFHEKDKSVKSTHKISVILPKTTGQDIFSKSIKISELRRNYLSEHRKIKSEIAFFKKRMMNISKSVKNLRMASFTPFKTYELLKKENIEVFKRKGSYNCISSLKPQISIEYLYNIKKIKLFNNNSLTPNSNQLSAFRNLMANKIMLKKTRNNIVNNFLSSNISSGSFRMNKSLLDFAHIKKNRCIQTDRRVLK